MSKIVEVEFVDHSMFMLKNGKQMVNVGGGDVEVRAKMDDGSVATAFRFYSNELSFEAEELVGKTLLQAIKLKLAKDLTFLRTP